MQGVVQGDSGESPGGDGGLNGIAAEWYAEKTERADQCGLVRAGIGASTERGLDGSDGLERICEGRDLGVNRTRIERIGRIKNGFVRAGILALREHGLSGLNRSTRIGEGRDPGFARTRSERIQQINTDW